AGPGGDGRWLSIACMVRYRAQAMMPSAEPCRHDRAGRRRARRAMLIAVGLGLVLFVAWLGPAVAAAPADNVAARDRDEDLRVERFLPLTAAAAGLVGVVIAARLGERRLGRGIRLAAPLLALALSLGPL